LFIGSNRVRDVKQSTVITGVYKSRGIYDFQLHGIEVYDELCIGITNFHGNIFVTIHKIVPFGI